MKNRQRTLLLLSLFLVFLATTWVVVAHDGHAHGGVVVIDHDDVQVFENNGNQLRGIATLGSGAKEFEVWRSNVAVGSKTPLHHHESEEVFVFLRGQGKARIGDEEIEFEAPCTIVAPKNVPHQFFNTGDVETDAVVVIAIGSKIWNEEGKVLELPWRQ
jgi:mannose-6-phosphate isomerase-like protein (cupin superfamily)